MSAQPSWYLRFQKLPLVILVSLLCSGIIGALRHIGVFEGIELWNHDQLVKLRSQAKPDSRMLLVAIDDGTLKKLNSDKVSDAALTQVLQTLAKYQPRVIAVDMIRDVPIGEGQEKLINYLNSLYEPLAGQIKPVIMTCQLPSAEQPEGIDPPPRILDLDSSVGFANIEVDPDQVIRRVPISSLPVPNAPKKEEDKSIIQDTTQAKCLVPFSLGFLASLRYLQQDNINIKQTSKGFFKLGDFVFQPPGKKAGSYQNLDPSLYQIILDYRLSNPVESISFSKILDGQIDPQQIKDKAVLIGYTTKDDVHLTPFGMEPGVLIHAQVINQILSNVLDKRPQVWYFPEPIEWLWLLTWGVTGGIISLKCRYDWQFLLAEGGAIAILWGSTFVLFTSGGWIPFIPSLLTLIAAAIVVKAIPQLKPASLPSTISPAPIPQPLNYTLDGEPEKQKTVVEGSGANSNIPKTVVEGSGANYNISETVVEPAPTNSRSESRSILPLNNSIEEDTTPWTNPPDDQSQAEEIADRTPVDKPIELSGSRREFIRTNPYIGQTLGGGRYRIEQLLGGGGMGQVYLASDTRLRDRPVAIKVMTTYSSSDNDNLIRRFQREAEYMASFSSMNIVKINDFGLTPEESIFHGAPFYVMEYLEGTTLTKRLEIEGKLSIKEIILIVRQICAGLREAHQMGIAHRDLKPDNIYLITHAALGEIVKILDFGIAKIVRDENYQHTSHTLTAMGAFIGTYHYASPEQCLGDARIDHRTDIYSLGVLIYEMLSGTNPYNIEGGQNTQGYWISSHISKKPQPLKTQPGCENLSQELEAVVMKCLEKSADERFANVDELEKALREAIPEFFRN